MVGGFVIINSLSGFLDNNASYYSTVSWLADN